VVTPAARRQAVDHLQATFAVSQRRACAVLSVDRTTVRYVSRRGDDADVRERMRALAAERRRFGYRRLHWLLGREGYHMNHKKFRRLYREERLQVRRRSGRKRTLGTRRPLELPHGIDQRWSLDFVSDAFTCGRRFRIFAVVDDYSRECVRLIADTSISGARVARELDPALQTAPRQRSSLGDLGVRM
jgi:putative transposase